VLGLATLHVERLLAPPRQAWYRGGPAARDARR
jgi:hypothetical protein